MSDFPSARITLVLLLPLVEQAGDPRGLFCGVARSRPTTVITGSGWAVRRNDAKPPSSH